jgi:hypothetical protein
VDSLAALNHRVARDRIPVLRGVGWHRTPLAAVTRSIDVAHDGRARDVDAVLPPAEARSATCEGAWSCTWDASWAGKRAGLRPGGRIQRQDVPCALVHDDAVEAA